MNAYIEKLYTIYDENEQEMKWEIREDLDGLRMVAIRQFEWNGKELDLTEEIRLTPEGAEQVSKAIMMCIKDLKEKKNG